jgi:large subunit ribosomal protein L32
MRRGHHALGKINVVVDATTGEFKLPHHISLEDGYYNGRQVVSVRSRQASEADEAASA